MKTLLGTLVVLALVLPACNRAAQQADPPPTETATAGPSTTPSAAPPTSAPTPAPSPATSEPEEDAAGEDPAGIDTVQAWYVRSHDRGPFVEPEVRHLDEPTVGVARAAFSELISGRPQTPGLSSLAPPGTRILGVSRRDDVLVLDVSEEVRLTRQGSAGEVAFAEQLAHTAAQFTGVRGVRLLVEGERISDLWGHLDWDSVQEPDEFAISPVVITSPTHGEAVDGGDVTVEGTANVFEATVELRLVNPDGDVVEETFTTATCGTGCRGDWSHTFSDVTTPGRWRVIAGASDPSDGEGGPPYRVSRAFTVR